MASSEQKSPEAALEGMARFSRIFLVTLIVMFLLNRFLPAPQKTQETISSPVAFLAQQTTSVAPHIPNLSLVNHASGSLTLDTCSAISLKRNDSAIDKKTYPADFCKTISLLSGATFDLSKDDVGIFEPLRKIFSTPATLTIDIEIQSGTTLHQTVIVENPSWFRSFFVTFFYQPIYNLQVFLLTILPGKSVGWSIILLTIIIRIILFFPQYHMMVANRNMQKIQPKIQELKEKHADNQQQLGMALMELYKEEKVNPLGACLPVLLQMPILIMLYWSVRDIGKSVATYFLYPFFSGFNPAHVDIHFLGLNLTASHNLGNIILAVVSVAVQYVQIRLSQPATNAFHDQQKQKDPNVPDIQAAMKMMLYVMPIMVGVSTYMFPAGVGLYWVIGTVFVALQQVIVNRLLAKKEQKKV